MSVLRRQVVVRASAGSGKTYGLTVHLIALLHAGADVGSILASTFTRKAAGEIQRRLLSRIAQAVADDDAASKLTQDLETELCEEERVDLLERVCRELDRLEISTLDSFFHRVARCFRHELDLAPDAVVVDEGDPRLRALRLEALQEVVASGERERRLRLLERIQREEPRREVLTSLLKHLDELLAAFREAPQGAWDAWQPPPGPPSTAQVQAAIHTLRALIETKEGAPFSKPVVADLERFSKCEWGKFLTTGVMAALFKPDREFSRKPIPASLAAPYEVLLAHVRAQVLPGYRALLDAAREVARDVDAAIRRLQVRDGLITYADVPDALRRAEIGGRTRDLAVRLNRTIDHLLLDEFQDTSPGQWALLRPLAETIGRREDRDGSFYCVGDPKQAIYGWRGGCPELFDRLDDSMPRLARLDQPENWRSSPVVLQFVDCVFGRILNGDEAGVDGTACKRWREIYQEHDPKKTSLAGFVEVRATAAKSVVAEADPDDDPTGGLTPHLKIVVDAVAEIRAARPGASVGVLVARNRPIPALIAGLRARGIDASGEGGASLDDDPAVETLLALCRFADHPGDAAVVALLRAGPLKDELQGTDPDARAAALRREFLRDGPGEFLFGRACSAAAWGGERSARRVEQLLQLAESWEPRGDASPSAFVDYVRAHPVEDLASAAVRVMTIHRAKGLEFDAVVLPDLTAGGGRDDDRLLLEREHPADLPTAVLPVLRKELLPLDERIARAAARKKERQEYEALCRLYVALTRARQGLYVLLEIPRKDDASLGRHLYHALRSLDPGLPEKLPDVLKEGPGLLLHCSGDPGWSLQTDGPGPVAPREPPRPHLAATTCARSWRREAPSELGGAGTVGVDELLRPEKTEAQLRGDAVHAALALVGWLEDGIPGRDDLLRAAREQAGPAVDGRLKAWIDAARLRIESPAFRVALRRPEGEVELWRERPFSIPGEAGTLVSGRFDRVHLVRENGRIVRAALFDYKTGEGSSDYTPQMRAYAAALSHMLDLPADSVTSTLLLLDRGEVRVVLPAR